MAFPVQRKRPIASLVGQPNGKLPRAILLDTPGQAGGATVTLVKPAALAWRAMCAAALRDGITLKVATADRSYRPYSSQETIFRARYYPSLLGTRRWQGRRWRKKAGVAAAAVPGTSNHGLGRAVDCGVELDGDAGTESFDAATLTWLKIHAHWFGWSWEIQSEPWHLLYWAGDALPKRVVEYLEGQGEAPLAEGNDMQYVADAGDVWLVGPGWHRDVSEKGLPSGIVATPVGGLKYILEDMAAAGVSIDITDARKG